MAGNPSFEIPAHPRRKFTRTGDLEYEGGAVFDLTPTPEQATDNLANLLNSVLSDGPYRYGDFRSVPMVLYLVRDEETGDVFRVSVRDGTVRLHVLPETESAGLKRIYDRLNARTAFEWSVECHS